MFAEAFCLVDIIKYIKVNYQLFILWVGDFVLIYNIFYVLFILYNRFLYPKIICSLVIFLSIMAILPPFLVAKLRIRRIIGMPVSKHTIHMAYNSFQFNIYIAIVPQTLSLARLATISIDCYSF